MFNKMLCKSRSVVVIPECVFVFIIAYCKAPTGLSYISFFLQSGHIICTHRKKRIHPDCGFYAFKVSV